MSSTVFVNGTTVQPAWLNDVNSAVYVNSVGINTYGAAAGNLDSVNKAALQAAIAACSTAGGGTVIVPPLISYGYKVTDSTTWPDFTNCVSPVLVEDHGPGKSYSGYPTAYDGKQIRRFYFTPQTTKPVVFTGSLLAGVTSGTLTSNWTDLTGSWIVTFSSGEQKYVTLTNGATTATWTGGLVNPATANAVYQNSGNHDGNTQWHRASWAPSMIVMNDAKLGAANGATRTAVDNRRANLYFGNDGNIVWKVGQGQLAGSQYTDEELSGFGITCYGSSTIGDYNWLTIERKTGNASFGGQLNTPPASYHFKSLSSGVVQMMTECATGGTRSAHYLRTGAGAAQDVFVRNNSGDLELGIDALGVALSVRGTNRRISPGLSFALQRVAATYSPSITLDSSAGNIFIINSTNSTAFTINAPTNLSVVSGEAQQITVTIKNTSGGALGTATWNAIFKMAAWTQPATGFSRSITFYHDGTNLIEMFRTTSDIPN